MSREDKTIEVSEEVKNQYMTNDNSNNSDDNSYAVSTSTSSNDEPEVFDSGLTVMENPKVIVPEEVRRVCVAIQEAVGYNEFGVLFKGEWTRDGFKVEPDFVIPDQEVSTATVQYEEDLKKYRDEGYIVNTHSHPMSGKNAGFSGTDDDHVNSHFDVALLYGAKDDTIAGGCANIKVSSGAYVQIDPEIERMPRTDEVLTDLRELKVKLERMGMSDAMDIAEKINRIDRDLPEVDTDNIEIKSNRSKRVKGQSNSGKSGRDYRVPSKYDNTEYERDKGGRRSFQGGRNNQLNLEGEKADEEAMEEALDDMIESPVDYRGEQ